MKKITGTVFSNDNLQNSFTNNFFELLERAVLSKKEVPRKSIEDFNLLVRNFEAKGKIYCSYQQGFQSKGRSDFLNLELYLKFAEVLVLLLMKFRLEIIWLNSLLKVVDLLVSIEAPFSPAMAERLKKVIDAELHFVSDLASDFASSTDRLGRWC